MNWQRRARMVVAVVGVSCAAAVYFFAGRRTVQPPRPPEQLKDEQATSEASNATLVRSTAAGVVSYELKSGHVAQYPDGRVRYDQKVELEAVRDQKFHIAADVAEEKGQAVARADDPGEVKMTGHVRLTTSKDLTLDTAEATYVDATGLVRIPGRLTFTRGRMSGEGVGGTYDRATGILWLQNAAHVVVAPDKQGGGGLDATANSIGLFRQQKWVRLEQRASIVRDHETLSADSALMYFTDDERNLRQVDLRGHSTVVPRGNPVEAAPDMRADDITLAFHSNTRTISQSTLIGHASLVQTNATGRHTITGAWIDARTGRDGQTLTGLDARDQVSVRLPAAPPDTPERIITASTLNATGTEKDGLTVARFDGGCEFLEMRPATRGQPARITKATSRTLTMALGGGLDAIDVAKFVQNATFANDQMSATGDVATYNAKKQTLLLQPADRGPKSVPHADDGRVTVNAHESILLSIESHDVVAKGEVDTTMRPSEDAPKGRATGLFEPGKPIRGFAPDFFYEDKAGKATYRGVPGTKATVVQDENRVEADVIVLEDESGNLNAKGGVSSTFLLDSSSTTASRGSKPPAAPSQQRATGREMDYRDAQRKATYTGDETTPAKLEGDTTITAATIEIYLAKEQRSVDRIEAEGDAYAVFDRTHEARGDHLTFQSDSETYFLTGRPAQVKTPKADASAGCQRQRGVKVTFQRGGDFAIDGGASLSETLDMNCEQPLTRTIRK